MADEKKKTKNRLKSKYPAAAMGVAREYLDRADAEGFPTHLCGYSLTTLGYASRMMKELKGQIPPEAPLGGIPKPLFLMSSAAICDARYNWFQALGRYMDVPVWPLEAPIPGIKEFFIEGYYDNMVKLGVKHLRDFVAFVEKMVGRKMDWDRLDKTANLMIEVNRVWHEVNELRKERPCPMHSRAFFDKLAERGWNFVVESFGYHPPIPLDLSQVSDPLERITKFSLQFLVGYFEDARKQNVLGGTSAYPYLKYAKEWKCDGALLHPLITCRSASTHLPYVSDMLLEKLKVPSLSIEGDIVDLRLFNPEDALARAEPFEETMEHYKRIRKQAGFDW